MWEFLNQFSRPAMVQLWLGSGISCLADEHREDDTHS
jgi:hypothetical protein